MAIQIEQDVELSLTENLVPVTISVRQFDHNTRRIRCALFKGGTAFSVPADAVISCTGARPDGTIFQYDSGSAPSLVFREDGRVVFTVTSFITAQAGRFPVDVRLLSEKGDVLGTFSLTLKVERSAIQSEKLATLTLALFLAAVAGSILQVFTTDSGHFGLLCEDGVFFEEGSESSMVSTLEEGMVQCSIMDDGNITFETIDALGLVFETDDLGRLVVEYEG